MNKLNYFAPETEALELKPEGVICESGDIYDMKILDPISGDDDYE